MFTNDARIITHTVYRALYTLSSVTGSGHVRYMASPFFYFYMTTCHVMYQLTRHLQVT